MADKEFYSTIEASKLLGVSVRTAQLWVENGSLEAWKTPGGHRRIVAKSVNDYINDNQTTPPRSSNKMRVLVVEDNPTVSKFYEAAIKSWGQSIEVIAKKDGFEGLLEIGRQVPDLLISDIYMPGMDGLQMIRSLYTSELLSVEKIIVISGLSNESIIERGGIPLGIDFFIKPVDVLQLKQAVFKKLSIVVN
ncbi:MAG: excisionase family DNA binding protein [Arenicella sp.]|jgi:excisionase family DNA binding protein